MDLSKQKNRIIMFFITYFLGMFGVHRFIQKDKKMGLLYLFTAGGFGLGWLYDCVRCFVNIFKYNPCNTSVQQTKKTEISETSIHVLDDFVEIHTEKVPVQKIKTEISSTSKNELKALYNEYQKTIFLFTQNNRALRNKDDYPGYLLYQLQITNPRLYHENMINEGYFISAPANNTLNSLKVTDLKKILEDKQAKTTGKKAELIERIISLSTPEELEHLKMLNPIYVLSEMGENYLRINHEYIKLYQHSNWNISLEEYVEMKKKLPFKSPENSVFYDVTWGIFNEKILKEDKLNHRNLFYHMYQSQKEINRLDSAIYYLLLVLYYDLSGIDYYHYIEYYHDEFYTKKEILEKEVNFMFAPGVLQELIDLEKYYSPELVEEIYLRNLPINCCSKELFKKFMNELYTQPTIDLEYYSDKLNAAFRKIIRGLK